MAGIEGGRRTAQGAIVLLCLAGLVLAAITVPTVGESVGYGSDVSGEYGSGASGASDSADGPAPGLDELLRWLVSTADGSGDSRDDGASDPGCELSIDPQDPPPGQVVTVTVTNAGDPVVDAVVRFDGERVGETDIDGSVRGRVPYVRDLNITATLPEGIDCETDERVAAAGSSTGYPVPIPAGSGTPADERTISESVEVGGMVRIVVLGQPDPGTTITTRTTVSGVPVRSASVRVNGQPAGETDTDGRFALTIPDDGTERLRLRIVRGAFVGERDVVVRILEARIVPDGLLAVPGEPATVRATRGEDPAVGASVWLDGRRVGSTGPDGRRQISLPVDPRSTVTVRHENRSRTVGVWVPYAGTALVLGFPSLVILSAVLGVMYRRNTTPGRVWDWLRRVGRRFGDRLLAVAIRIAGVLDRVASWIRGTLGRLSGLRSGRALLRLGTGLLVGLLAWGHRALTRRLGRLRRSPAWLLPWRQPATPPDNRPGDGSPPGRRPAATDPLDLREAWRTVARRIAPTGWRTRTPREVVSTAEDRGVPLRPIDQLATIFEEVEYGDRPLTDARRERARAAVEAVMDHFRGSDTEEGGG